MTCERLNWQWRKYTRLTLELLVSMQANNTPQITTAGFALINLFSCCAWRAQQPDYMPNRRGRWSNFVSADSTRTKRIQIWYDKVSVCKNMERYAWFAGIRMKYHILCIPFLCSNMWWPRWSWHSCQIVTIGGEGDWVRQTTSSVFFIVKFSIASVLAMRVPQPGRLVFCCHAHREAHWRSVSCIEMIFHIFSYYILYLSVYPMYRFQLYIHLKSSEYMDVKWCKYNHRLINPNK